MNRIQELFEWLQSVPADFAFLLALPFVVGAAGLAAEWYRRRLEAPPNPPVAAVSLRGRASAGMPR